MLDIKYIREHLEEAQQRLDTRNEEYDLKKVVDLDAQRRKMLTETEAMKQKQKQASKKIPQMKKAGEDCTEIFAEMKTLSDQIKEMDEAIRTVEGEIKNTLLYIPNLPHADAVVGKDDTDNPEVRRYGEQRTYDIHDKPH